jgi:hypothetical protein
MLVAQRDHFLFHLRASAEPPDVFGAIVVDDALFRILIYS